MTESENKVPERLEKLKRIREEGINPYPATYHRTHQNAQALSFFQQHEGNTELISETELNLAGRVLAMRTMGKMAFMDIRDVSAKIQLHFSQNTLGDAFALLKEINIGDFLGARGKLFRTRSGEITLEVAGFSLLAKSLHALPEKWHGLVDVEKRYRQRYLDLISNEEAKDLFIKRSGIITAMRQFLDGQGYIEVETPVFQPLAGGAMAKPFITHHHALDEDLYLRIALELYLKRACFS
jgi:lysyl-tRNA synthetase class 2